MPVSSKISGVAIGIARFWLRRVARTGDLENGLWDKALYFTRFVPGAVVLVLGLILPRLSSGGCSLRGLPVLYTPVGVSLLGSGVAATAG